MNEYGVVENLLKHSKRRQEAKKHKLGIKRKQKMHFCIRGSGFSRVSPPPHSFDTNFPSPCSRVSLCRGDRGYKKEAHVVPSSRRVESGVEKESKPPVTMPWAKPTAPQRRPRRSERGAGGQGVRAGPCAPVQGAPRPRPRWGDGRGGQEERVISF